jgi:hypothetical protein
LKKNKKEYILTAQVANKETNLFKFLPKRA